MKNGLFLLLCLCFLVGSLSCGSSPGSEQLVGGSEAGNPPGYRDLMGVVPSASTSTLALKQATTSFVCQADTVVATDLTGLETPQPILDDCSFELTLAIDKAYSLHFNSSGSLLAEMVFDNNGGLPASLMWVSEAETAIDLGQIIFKEGLAYPENQPASQNDRDGDGVNDFEDTDDDGDGDSDGVGDNSDNCAEDANRDQTDHDADGAGDECDE